MLAETKFSTDSFLKSAASAQLPSLFRRAMESEIAAQLPSSRSRKYVAYWPT